MRHRKQDMVDIYLTTRQGSILAKGHTTYKWVNLEGGKVLLRLQVNGKDKEIKKIDNKIAKLHAKRRELVVKKNLQEKREKEPVLL